MAAVGAARPAPAPNFGGELSTLFLGCVVNDLPAGVVCASGVLKGGLGISRDGISSRVVLSSALALAASRHREPKPSVTALAEPAEIIRRTVRLVAVLAVYYQEAG